MQIQQVQHFLAYMRYGSRRSTRMTLLALDTVLHLSSWCQLDVGCSADLLEAIDLSYQQGTVKIGDDSIIMACFHLACIGSALCLNSSLTSGYYVTQLHYTHSWIPCPLTMNRFFQQDTAPCHQARVAKY